MSIGSGNGRRGGAGGDIPQNIVTAISEISERSTLLVREEIELAKAEVAEKAGKLVRGAIVGVVAAIFFVTALFFVLIGLAWLLYYYLPIGGDFTYFWGFFAMAVILVVLGLIAVLIAARAVKRGSPPVPDMAIEEARLIRDTVATTPETPYLPQAPQSLSSAPAHSGGFTTAAPYGAAAPAGADAPTRAPGTVEPAPSGGAASPSVESGAPAPSSDVPSAPIDTRPSEAGTSGPADASGPSEDPSSTVAGAQPSAPADPGASTSPEDPASTEADQEGSS